MVAGGGVRHAAHGPGLRLDKLRFPAGRYGAELIQDKLPERYISATTLQLHEQVL